MVRPETVWDLGANTGRFSRLASDRGIPTAAFDFDPACVELNYRAVKARQESRLLPLLIDLMNPSPASGWANRERASILERGQPEMVLALALIHHLAIAGNLPLENIAEFFRGLAPWLAIEFVGPDDSQVQKLMTQRGGVHHLYTPGMFRTMLSTLLFHSSRPTDRAREAHPVPDAPRGSRIIDRWVIHPFLLAIFPILGLFAQNSLQVPFGHLYAPIALGLAVTLTVWLVATGLLRDSRKAGVFTTLELVPFWLG